VVINTTKRFTNLYLSEKKRLFIYKYPNYICFKRKRYQIKKHTFFTFIF